MNRFYQSSIAVLIVAAFSFIPAQIWAGGSVGFEEDVLPILKSRPVFERFILEAFKMRYNGNGWGERISNEVMPNMGGARIGPYKFQATWHGLDGDTPITLIINTNTKFLNRVGREVVNEIYHGKRVRSVKETLDNIEILPDGGYGGVDTFTNPSLAAAPHAEIAVSFQADILPIFKTSLAFEKFILGTFKISDAGRGKRISQQSVPHFGGVRMSPYRFRATWHSSDGDVPVTLIINTANTFSDSKGQEISRGSLKSAVSLTETLNSIEIDPPKN